MPEVFWMKNMQRLGFEWSAVKYPEVKHIHVHQAGVNSNFSQDQWFVKVVFGTGAIKRRQLANPTVVEVMRAVEALYREGISEGLHVSYTGG